MAASICNRISKADVIDDVTASFFLPSRSQQLCGRCTDAMFEVSLPLTLCLVYFLQVARRKKKLFIYLSQESDVTRCVRLRNETRVTRRP